MADWTITVGWTLVHFLWEGALVALLAAVALWLMRGASAQARYLTACAALVAALVAPLATAPTIAMMTSMPHPTGVTPVVAPAPVEATFGAADRDGLAGRGADLVRSARANLTRFAPRTTNEAHPSPVLSWLAALWMFGVAILTVRLAAGWWRVRRLHALALAEPASPWLESAVGIARRLQLARVIHVVDSHLVDTPTVIGWLQPVVLLPIAALANLSPAQVRAILAHELAHIRRHDFLVNVLQTLAETLLFYHPAIWWLSARIRVEREHCCDDIAVEVCGDPVIYVEALTELASWAATASRLAMAATGGSLLTRVRRLLLRPGAVDRRRPRAGMVIAVTLVLIALAGMRWMLVAQVADAPGATPDVRIGPPQINRLLGYELFPTRAPSATEDPADARAWDVSVTFPGGETAFKGFTARSLVRYGYNLDDTPVMDGPSWLDTESHTLRAETSAPMPDVNDYRQAIRAALEQQYGIAIRRDARPFPVLAMVPARAGRLGPNIHPTAIGCLEGRRTKPDTAGPILIQRGQQTAICGFEDSITGFRGIRVSMAELAASLRRYPLGGVSRDAQGHGRDVVDQTGISGDFDFTLGLGFLPLAAIATAHPDLAGGLGTFGVHTLPAALEQQLGLRLIQTKATRDIVVIASAQRRPS